MSAAIPAPGTVREVVKQLDAARERAVLHVGGHDLTVSNLDKARENARALALEVLRQVPQKAAPVGVASLRDVE